MNKPWHNWQLNIAYTLARNNLEFAEQLLQSGLDEARSNSEKRRIAHYQATYARLARQQGNMVQAREWANKALEGFKVEGMAWDAEDMRSLLDQVASNDSNNLSRCN